jgi:polyisoprenoid-binding protein YceI
MRKPGFYWLIIVGCSLGLATAADVDPDHSSIVVKVEKTGLFSGFAHNHTIRASIASGQLDPAKRTVEFTISTKKMKVEDEGVKASENTEIEQTMKSEKVLDVERFPEIRFQSTSISEQGSGRYQVRGDLTLHGTTRPVEFPVAFAGSHYTGTVKLKQTNFGIAPVSIAGGTVKVKDVIEIVFDIASK